jgi:uncharacterized metal-binding protein YceD (DUF177 family)
MNEIEFSRTADIRQIDAAPLYLVATDSECAALARRFDLVAVKRLEATLSLVKDDAAVLATGTLSADIIQSCAISGEDLPVLIREALVFRFAPARQYCPDEELELEANELDEIEFTGTSFDLGEAVAQSLVLAINPFAEGPDAEHVRREMLGDAAASGPFAVLAALRKSD